jgi:hypothetical protein
MSNILLKMFSFVFFIFVASAQEQQKTIQLERDLILTGDNIGMVQGINVDKRGHIYVGDIINATIHLYSATGQHLQAIGRKGRGPGEFSQIGGSQLNTGDSLYILDGNLRRVTLVRSYKFEAPALTFTLPGGPEGEAPSMTGSVRSGHTGLWVTPRNQLLIGYSPPYTPRTWQQPRYFKLYQVDITGKFVSDKPVVQVADRQWLVLAGDKGFSVTLMPFASHPVICVGPEGHLYYGHTDSLSISRVDLEGRKMGTIQYPVKRIRITSQMWKQELEQWPDRSLNMDMIRRSKTPVPEYLPCFEDFLVDDTERVWVATNTEDQKNYRWLIFDKQGKLAAEFSLTKEVMLKLVRNGYAYGIQTKSDGLQSVVRYRVIENNMP